MVTKRDWQPIIDFLNTAVVSPEATVGLFPHGRADYDALGSCLALAHALSRAKIKTVVVVGEEPPRAYSFIPEINNVVLLDEANTMTFSHALMLDCAQIARLGERSTIFSQVECQAVIDHHLVAADVEINIVDSDAAATAELVYELLRKFEVEISSALIDTVIAKQLLIAIMGDTGRFAFSNTTAKTLEIAADLMRYEPKLAELVKCQFMTSSLAKMRLSGRVFLEAKIDVDGRLATATLTAAQMNEFQAQSSDVDHLASEMRQIDGVMVAILLRQLENGEIRLNIRSEVGFDASALATTLGGGGHACAAGASMSGDLEACRVKLIALVQRQIEAV